MVKILSYLESKLERVIKNQNTYTIICKILILIIIVANTYILLYPTYKNLFPRNKHIYKIQRCWLLHVYSRNMGTNNVCQQNDCIIYYDSSARWNHTESFKIINCS